MRQDDPGQLLGPVVVELELGAFQKNDVAHVGQGSLDERRRRDILNDVYRNGIAAHTAQLPPGVAERARDSLAFVVNSADRLGAPGQAVLAAARNSFVDGFSVTMLVAAMVMALGAVVVFGRGRRSDAPASGDHDHGTGWERTVIALRGATPGTVTSTDGERSSAQGAFETTEGDLAGRSALWGIGPDGTPAVVAVGIDERYSIMVLSYALELDAVRLMATELTPASQAEWIAHGGKVLDDPAR